MEMRMKTNKVGYNREAANSLGQEKYQLYS